MCLTKWSGLLSVGVRPRGKAKTAPIVRVRIRRIVVEIQVEGSHLPAIVSVAANISYVPAEETKSSHSLGLHGNHLL